MKSSVDFSKYAFFNSLLSEASVSAPAITVYGRLHSHCGATSLFTLVYQYQRGASFRLSVAGLGLRIARGACVATRRSRSDGGAGRLLARKLTGGKNHIALDK